MTTSYCGAALLLVMCSLVFNKENNMAKAIVTRQLEVLPANPASRVIRLMVEDIESIDISSQDKPGRTVIVLRSGHRKYSSEDVLEVCRAYREAKGESDRILDSSKGDGVP